MNHGSADPLCSFHSSVKPGALGSTTINAYGERLVKSFVDVSLTPLTDRAPQLYDICMAKESPYFVVTNYYGCVFGAFSKGTWPGLSNRDAADLIFLCTTIFLRLECGPSRRGPGIWGQDANNTRTTTILGIVLHE